MATELLETLRGLLADDLDSVEVTGTGLSAIADARWGRLSIRMDYEEDEEEADSGALRVSVPIASPPGGGRQFIVFCLALNVQYWGVKTGLDDEGLLVLHADIEADEPPKLLAADVLDRVESIMQMLDEDMCEFCLANSLGTPAQRKRWEERRPASLAGDEGDDDDDSDDD